MNERTAPFFRSAQDTLTNAILGLTQERELQETNNCNILAGVNFGSEAFNLETKTAWTRNSFQATLQRALNDLYRHELWVADRESITSQATQTVEVTRAQHHDSATAPFDYDRVRAAIVHTTSRTRSGRPYQRS